MNGIELAGYGTKAEYIAAIIRSNWDWSFAERTDPEADLDWTELDMDRQVDRSLEEMSEAEYNYMIWGDIRKYVRERAQTEAEWSRFRLRVILMLQSRKGIEPTQEEIDDAIDWIIESFATRLPTPLEILEQFVRVHLNLDPDCYDQSADKRIFAIVETLAKHPGWNDFEHDYDETHFDPFDTALMFIADKWREVSGTVTTKQFVAFIEKTYLDPHIEPEQEPELTYGRKSNRIDAMRKREEKGKGR